MILGGYDRGGLSACVVSALWPHRFTGLATLGGYDIIDIRTQRLPHTPAIEYAVWYQHLFRPNADALSWPAPGPI